MDRRGARSCGLLKDLAGCLDHDPREPFFSPYPSLFVTAEVGRWVDYIMDEQMRALPICVDNSFLGNTYVGHHDLL